MLRFVPYGLADLSNLDQARQLLTYISRSPEFAPEWYGKDEPIQRFDLEKAVTTLVGHPHIEVIGDIFLERKRTPRGEFHLMWVHAPGGGPFEISSYQTEEKWLRKPANLERWLEFCFSLLPLHEAWYAYWALEEEETAKQNLRWRVPPNHPHLQPGGIVEAAYGGVLTRGVPEVLWGTYFSPFYVEWFGRERFETLPCVEKRELPTGGVFFTTAPTPWDWNKPESRRLQRQVMAHLGADAFFDMEAFRERVRRELGKGGIYKPEQLLPRYRVPEFSFRTGPRPPAPKSLEERRAETIQSQEALGLKLVEEPQEGVLVFEGDQGERVRIDLKQGTVDHWPKV